uniref:Latent-transforming growth factor beta-binding protein 1 n=1 Tax=Amphiprion percula TaxID=161767 RepID=A0A3P8TW60_AMPPE
TTNTQPEAHVCGVLVKLSVLCINKQVKLSVMCVNKQVNRLFVVLSVLCPLLCQNGGVCLQKDRCLCPPNFTGKFCQIPVSSSSTNEIVRPAGLAAMATNQELTRSEFLLPLGQNREETRSEALGPSMVKVRVQHPPEASVKIHQVLKVGTETCSSPLPGLRSREMCCRGIGKAWGITDCVLCPENTAAVNLGYERVNGTQCVDVNECLQPGLCENGFCVNTRGSYSCVCRPGFILDASHGLCISHSVISEEKGQCYRVLGSGLGPGSCSLPILRNITKQICCCSRVGKAWGTNCQRCPYFGSVAFKEICPAGPGYHYSASALQFNQRVTDPPQPNLPPQPRPQPNLPPQLRPAAGSPSRPIQPGGGTTVAQVRPGSPYSRPDSAPSLPTQPRPQPPSTGSQGSTNSDFMLRVNNLCVNVCAYVCLCVCVCVCVCAAVQSVCESRPGVCGRGRCVDQPGGKHTCVCDQGFQLNAQRTNCQDVNECVQTAGVCSVGKCVNSAGSFRCVCPSGYKNNNQQNDCQDIDECQQNPCSNGRCDNTPGSYRCVCRLGYRLTGNTCTDIDECRQAPCSNGRCENTPGSYRCVCRHDACPDVDECLKVGVCDAERVCVNTVGSFRCDCQPGYRTSGLGRQCRDFCFSRGECVNTPGSFTCVCSRGFTLNVSVMTVQQCPEPSASQGEFHPYLVPPRSFLTTSATSATDTDVDSPESSGSVFGCINELFLIISVNNYYVFCADVDECLKSGICSDGRCLNTEGSFQCQCETGFTANPEKNACLGTPVNRLISNELLSLADVDECVSSGGSVCGSQRCENTIGSYRCLTSCEPGYQATLGGGCVDVNECGNTTVCGEHAFCQNLIGTYLCVCDQGFTSTVDGKACEDEDECVSLPGVCGSARCENMEGSFMCECDRAGEEFDTTTKRCGFPPTTTLPPLHPPLLRHPPLRPPPPRPPGRPPPSMSLRECYYNLAERGTCSLLATNTSQQECCCTVGEGWGLGCQYHTCPPPDTAEFLSLCPSGRGYITAGPGAFSYTDVDECKRFLPEVCKNGVCVNNIPGYSCYCSSGYVYNSTLLECIDHDECEEESCVGGICVNTVGSYYCSCQHPLVLDDTQRNCVNSSHLTNLSVCWQQVTADLLCQNPLLGAQVTFMDCCCLYGEGWGMGCALCPSSDSGKQQTNKQKNTTSMWQNGHKNTGYYPEGDYGPPDGSRPPSFRLPPDPRAEISFGAQPPPPSRPDAPPLSLAPLPGAPRYEEEEEEEEEERSWRPGPPFPPFTDRSRGGAAPRRKTIFTSLSSSLSGRYESYASLSAAEDCGILHGCENGRCIRVAEGYTCDCYQGYELDMTSMTCIDINECEDAVGLEFPCVNARCVNTDGSFRCVCRRGYVMSRRPNHCVAA